MTAEKPKESILAEAERTVNGPRARDYGSALDTHQRIADLWSPILGVKISAEQVALCMVQVKVARLCQTPSHRDSEVDIAGYAWVHNDIVEERRRRTIAPPAPLAGVREMDDQGR